MEIVTSWLTSEFPNPNTRLQYRSALRSYAAALNITDFAMYIATLSPNQALQDLRRYLAQMRESPPKTVMAYSSTIRLFLREHGVDISRDEWKKLKRRGHLPKRVRALTRDRPPTKGELRRILNHLDVRGKALILFLVSSGCRVGEAVQLLISDLNLDAEPPEAFIRGSTTKSGVGERNVFFSFEARDALQSWLKVKESRRKRMKGDFTFGGALVFPITNSTVGYLWRRALVKTGLDERDERTNWFKLHLHTLRKFFRSNVGLELDVVHALMGHVEYLDDAYRRISKERMKKDYLNNMDRVSVYGVRLDGRIESLEEENQQLREDVEELRLETKGLKTMMGYMKKALSFAASKKET